MDIGVVSRSFPQLTNEQTAKLLAQNGFRWTELCFSQVDSKYWVYNGRADLTELTDEESMRIIETYKHHGITVTSIGIFTNLMEPDEIELQRNLDYFERMMQIASINNVPYVATECGFIPGRRGIQAETYEPAFRKLVENFKWLSVRYYV